MRCPPASVRAAVFAARCKTVCQVSASIDEQQAHSRLLRSLRLTAVDCCEMCRGLHMPAVRHVVCRHLTGNRSCCMKPIGLIILCGCQKQMICGVIQQPDPMHSPAAGVPASVQDDSPPRHRRPLHPRPPALPPAAAAPAGRSPADATAQAQRPITCTSLQYDCIAFGRLATHTYTAKKMTAGLGRRWIGTQAHRSHADSPLTGWWPRRRRLRSALPALPPCR